MLSPIHQIPVEISSNWSRLLSGFSLEVPVSKAESLQRRPGVLAPGSEIYLPHLSDKDTSQLKDAYQHVMALGYISVPHVGARHLSGVGRLCNHLNAARSGGATRLLVLAGDRDDSAGPFSDALDILNDPAIADLGFAHVSVTGYPEGHPRISQSKLNDALEKKLTVLDKKAIGASITTQFGFDPISYVSWIEALRARGTGTMIGVAGVTSIPSLIKYAVLCGVGPSFSTLKKRSGAMIGLFKGYEPTDLLDELARAPQLQDDSNVSVHFFPFGGATKMLDWREGQMGARND